MTAPVAPGDDTTSGLDRRAELREFLRSRRARLSPQDVGVPMYGRRRVPGLRREELAQLAGVSYAYYVRLEQGYGDTVSTDVLDAVARALRLTEEEHDYLVRLAQPDRRSTTAAPEPSGLRPSVRHLLDTVGTPAFVVDRRMDVLGWNRLAAAVFGDPRRLAPEERNVARLAFLSPEMRGRFADPSCMARRIAAVLRMNAGKSPEDAHFAALIGELSDRSEEFRRLWARHDVSCGTAGERVRLRHALVGEYVLVHEPMALRGGAPMRIVTFVAEPGSYAEEALRMLASWDGDPHRP
ncbi:helix-turn-helix transcriptional regulator [Streptomyces roseirectus]|uniref:Helix-turn-helix transcriptional regulator n=1 Tax=Streptomyces roseirectus TaxID=2768066 RepID=A0A7H0I7C0_9ACTN|nr:helix-turn-helix transcriptional regulator [Streptomyces roseirectus]QNP68686.1 helix-turn-helix transcriptional regulator [Streptomyces roseirectus]